MKVLKIASGNKIAVAQTDSVKLNPWELRISVALSCICGSDMKSIATPKYENQTPGHEFAGVVSELSVHAADSFNVGDRVTAFPMVPCHLCSNCAIKNFRDCDAKKSIGFDLQGSFAEELVVDSRMVIKLPKDLTMSQGALLEHLCCGYRLADDFVNSNIDLDSRIAILGDGPICLADLQMLILRGYTNLSVYGKYPFRLKYASALGAQAAININALDSYNVIDSQHIDVCIVASPSDLLIKKLLSKFYRGGYIFEQTKISDPELRSSLISIGSKMTRAFAYQIGDFTEVIKLIIRGDIDTSKLITSKFSLEEVAQSYPSLLGKQENIKVAVISNSDLLDL